MQNAWEIRNTSTVLSKNLKGKGHFRDLNADGWIKLKWIFNKEDYGVARINLAHEGFNVWLL
jgi:hypothetical protein